MAEFDDYFEDHFPKFSRSFRKLISVDPTSQRTLENLKSQTAIKAEMLRHILFHPNIIHCFSRFR